MTRLPAHLVWHETGWNGCVCRQPYTNSACIVQQQFLQALDWFVEQVQAAP